MNTLQWVKASDRLPNSIDEYHVEMIHENDVPEDQPTKAIVEFCSRWNVEKGWTVTKWLEENEEPMPAFFSIDLMKKLINQYDKEEITISRFVEILNEKATGVNSLQRHSYYHNQLEQAKVLSIRFNALAEWLENQATYEESSAEESIQEFEDEEGMNSKLAMAAAYRKVNEYLKGS